VFEEAPINLCPPGGVKTLRALGNLLNQDITPYIAEMEKKRKPKLLAIIREPDCIGCTKCIQACPVDAILGCAKQMHTIIASECTGCELCVPVCPVDCIEMIAMTMDNNEHENSQTNAEQEKANYFRMRYNARQARLIREKNSKNKAKWQATLQEKKSYIEQAISRAKAKKK
jgi:electron transport complex protein RnfB